MDAPISPTSSVDFFPTGWEEADLFFSSLPFDTTSSDARDEHQATFEDLDHTSPIDEPGQHIQDHPSYTSFFGETEQHIQSPPCGIISVPESEIIELSSLDSSSLHDSELDSESPPPDSTSLGEPEKRTEPIWTWQQFQEYLKTRKDRINSRVKSPTLAPEPPSTINTTSYNNSRVPFTPQGRPMSSGSDPKEFGSDDEYVPELNPTIPVEQSGEDESSGQNQEAVNNSPPQVSEQERTVTDQDEPERDDSGVGIRKRKATGSLGHGITKKNRIPNCPFDWSSSSEEGDAVVEREEAAPEDAVAAPKQGAKPKLMGQRLPPMPQPAAAAAPPAAQDPETTPPAAAQTPAPSRRGKAATKPKPEDQGADGAKTTANPQDTRRAGHDRKITELTRRDCAVWQSLKDQPDGSGVEKAYADAYAAEQKKALPRHNEKAALRKTTLQKQCRTINRMLEGTHPEALIQRILAGGPAGELALQVLNQQVFFARTRWDREPLTLADVQLWRHNQSGTPVRVIQESHAGLTGISVTKVDLDHRYQFVDRVFGRSQVDERLIADVLASIEGGVISTQTDALRRLNASLIGLDESGWLEQPSSSTPAGEQREAGRATRPAATGGRVEQGGTATAAVEEPVEERVTTGGKQPTWAWHESAVQPRDEELRQLRHQLAATVPLVVQLSTPAGPAGWAPQHVFVVRMRLTGDNETLGGEQVYVSLGQANRAAVEMLAGRVTGDVEGGEAREEATAAIEQQVGELGQMDQPFDGEVDIPGLEGETVHVWVESVPLNWG